MSVAIGESTPGRQGGDARLVAEGGEVVDPGQAHHLPPGVLVVRPCRLVRPLHLLRLILEQPVWRGIRAAGSGGLEQPALSP